MENFQPSNQAMLYIVEIIYRKLNRIQISCASRRHMCRRDILRMNAFSYVTVQGYRISAERRAHRHYEKRQYPTRRDTTYILVSDTLNTVSKKCRSILAPRTMASTVKLPICTPIIFEFYLKLYFNKILWKLETFKVKTKTKNVLII